MTVFARRTLMVALATVGLIAPTQAVDMSDDAILERIKPVGNVYLQSDQPTLAKITEPRSGEVVYNGYCTACHTSGVLGAPKMNDLADWAPRLAQGIDTVNKHAIQGFNAMPAKGTCMDCSDDEIIAAINHMINGLPKP